MARELDRPEPTRAVDVSDVRAPSDALEYANNRAIHLRWCLKFVETSRTTADWSSHCRDVHDVLCAHFGESVPPPHPRSDLRQAINYVDRILRFCERPPKSRRRLRALARKRPTELSRATLEVLAALLASRAFDRGTSIPGSVIAKTVHRDRSTVAKRLAPAIEAGFVDSWPHPRAGYALSEHGRKFLSKRTL